MVKKKKSQRNNKKNFGERKELIFRILIGIISGLIIGIWRYLIFAFTIFNFFYVLFIGKRNKELAELCEYWNSESYTYLRYITFESNKRPFPFNSLNKLGKFE